MRIRPKKSSTQSRPRFESPGERGFVATVLFIALLVVMLMLAVAGGKALFHLHSEVKTLEQQQINRLNSSMKNSVANSHLSITRVGAK